MGSIPIALPPSRPMPRTIKGCPYSYYENHMSDHNHLENTYVNADIRLDPDGELLPTDCYMELHAAVTRQSKHLA